MVEEFFLNRAKAGYDEVAGRIEQLVSGQRLQETTDILAEAGFMPELGEDEETGESVKRWNASHTCLMVTKIVPTESRPPDRPAHGFEPPTPALPEHKASEARLPRKTYCVR